ncbi:uncharacterized protein LOC131218389 isoform X1 [Magnolia sinica]|uniref:uncharacterized protein LOC131218389 isoform X1 n=1 Tax=Magnolia sinica TaxID=86752 RepID=UPI0026597235|nr:uncharacterized protein LOC131218389 isoform X1 [Magnolia sinica]
MTGLPEITELFTKLASYLHCNSSPSPAHESEPLALAISSLSESLNHNETPLSASRVLDASLSLMCFKAPALSDSLIECLSETIVAVLSSSVSCRVSFFPEEDLLQVRSSISCGDCAELIGACAHVIASLDGYGTLSHKLLRAVLKVATSACCCQSLFPLPSIGYENSRCKIKAAVSKLNSFLPEETSASTCETPLRLLLWYLDPSSLKYDISRILQEKMERPFLCLKKELHERMAWRSVVICLVTSPTMFIEVKVLLHHWFLMTGLASVLELRTELVSSLLDALARPMRWGMSMELGLKLPFSCAYFPNKHHNLLVLLMGPISCERFLDLVHVVMGPVSYTKKHVDPTALHPSQGIFKQTTSEAMVIDHKSTWAMLMDFPTWLYFAAMLLFSGKQCQDIFPSTLTPTEVECETYDSELRCAAARYLAWILNPINETQNNQLFDCVIELSGSWMLKQKEASAHRSHSRLDACVTDTMNCRKKLKKPKIKDRETEHMSEVELWLKDFNNRCVAFYNKVDTSHEAKTASVVSMQSDLLFRKIPLGILIGCSRYLDEKAYELLLHYAVTGEILVPRETQNSRKKHAEHRLEGCDDGEDSSKLSEESDGREGAVSGASLVFYLFDIIDEMSASMLESEDGQCDFVCHMKGKASRYLFKCIKKLLELQKNGDEGRGVMLMDLNKRLERWRQQGREVFEGSDTFNDMVCDLNCKISSENQI